MLKILRKMLIIYIYSMFQLELMIIIGFKKLFEIFISVLYHETVILISFLYSKLKLTEEESKKLSDNYGIIPTEYLKIEKDENSDE